MIISTWNVRGLNHPSKISEVKRLVKSNRVNIIAILETRVKRNSGIVQKKLIARWQWLDNYELSPKGIIWVRWDPNCINVQMSAAS